MHHHFTLFFLLTPLCAFLSLAPSLHLPLHSSGVGGGVLLIVGAVMLVRSSSAQQIPAQEEAAQKNEQDVAITMSAGNPTANAAIASLGFTPRHHYNEDSSMTSSRPPSVIYPVQDPFLRPPSVYSVPSRPGSAADFVRAPSPSFLLRPPFVVPSGSMTPVNQPIMIQAASFDAGHSVQLPIMMQPIATPVKRANSSTVC